jgi:hypothetical protein
MLKLHRLPGKEDEHKGKDKRRQYICAYPERLWSCFAEIDDFNT